MDFLEHGLSFHVARELSRDDNDSVDIVTRLKRAFLMTDIHSRKIGLLRSGSTVATCLVQVSAAFLTTVVWKSPCTSPSSLTLTFRHTQRIRISFGLSLPTSEMHGRYFSTTESRNDCQGTTNPPIRTKKLEYAASEVSFSAAV